MHEALVVDDSGVMRKIVTRSLEKVGVANVFEAEDGVQGFELFQQRNFELVLTDWNMPNRDGLELIRDIRATGSTVPIIMLTTEVDRDRVIEAIRAGANDYLAKPFEAATLRDKLARYTEV